MLDIVLSVSLLLGGGQKSPKRKRRASRWANRFRPRVDRLEDRLAPADLTVSNLKQAGTGSLRQAIVEADGSGDASSTITIDGTLQGTIKLEFPLQALTKNITISDATYGAVTVTTDPPFGGSFTIFQIAQDVKCEIDGLNIVGGASANGMGGGIYNLGTLTLNGCTIAKNTGSGIYNASSGNLTLLNCTVSGNSNTGGYGGGIDNDGGSLTVAASNISGNSAEFGGGIANQSLTSSLDIQESNIDNNTATADGGGIWNYGQLTYSGGTLSNNTAVGNGGGIQIESGIVGFNTVTFWENKATGATSYGGGFFLRGGVLTLDFVTLTGNQAKTGPGGAWRAAATFANNNPTAGNDAIVALKPGVGFLTPDTGAVTGGTAVALFGQGFDSATGVLFGSAPAAFQVVANDEILALAPAEEAGPVDVTVTNSAGSSATSPADLFTFSGSVTNTTVALSSAGTTTYGQPVTLTATVSSDDSTIPTGSVTFFTSCGTALGTAAVNSAGVATWTLTSQPAGSDELTAVYSGDANDAGAAASLEQTVSQASTSITLTTSAPSAQAGSPVTLTAAVTSPTAATVSGSVQFWQIDPTTGDDLSFLGASPVTASAPAMLTLSTLPPGSDLIEAQFAGGRDFASSAATLTEVITDNPTVTGATPAVGASAGGSAVLVTGQFFTGATAVSFGGTAALSFSVLSDMQLLAVAPALPAGAVDVTVTTAAGASATNPADQFTASSTLSPTTTTLSSSGNTSYGQALTLTATVSAASGTPTGSVTFLDGDGDLLGTAAVNGAGVATLTVTSLDAGSGQLTALYTGDPNFAGSAGTLEQTVNQAATTTTLTTSMNPAVAGTPVTLTVAVTSTLAGTPTGLVLFWQVDPVSGADLNLLGAGTLDGASQATLTLATLPAGSTTVQAQYLGNQDFTGSNSAALTQVVTLGSTTTTLSSSLNPATAGASVTFTADVSSQAGLIPTGTVTFYNGASVLGTAAVNAGLATFTTTALPVGTDSITAVYGGDASNSGSSSAVLSEVVNPAQTLVMLSSSSNPALPGQPVTFTANVMGAGGVTPTGTITFYDGTAVLAVVSLDGTGMAALTVSDLAVGAHSITAVYSGDATYAASSSSALQEVIDGLASSTSLTSSQNPAPAGTPVTFTATVSSLMEGTPTGQVQFWVLDPATLLPVTLLGAGTLNSSGQANLTVSSLTSGSYLIEALYLGDGTFNSSSATLTQQIS
jgi:hypothetical protein